MVFPFMLYLSPALLNTKDRTFLTADKHKSEKLRQHTGCPLFLQWCLWSAEAHFLQPLVCLQRSLLSPHPSLCWGKGPFRKPFRSFRHSWTAGGGLLLTLVTATLPRPTLLCSPSLNFGNTLPLPCPAAISNECKGTTWIVKCFFSLCLLLLTSQITEPRNVTNTEMKADDFRAEVKFSGRISLLDQAAFITRIATPRLA